MVTYVLRLTPQEIRDVAVGQAEPSASVVTQGEPVEIRSRIRYDVISRSGRTQARWTGPSSSSSTA